MNRDRKAHHEGVIERGEDVGHAEDVLPIPHGWTKGDILFLLGSDFLLSRLQEARNIRVSCRATLQPN